MEISREKEGYRDNLARVTERFGVELIPLKEAAAFCGCDPRTLVRDKNSPVKKIRSRLVVPAVALARWLCV